MLVVHMVAGTRLYLNYLANCSLIKQSVKFRVKVLGKLAGGFAPCMNRIQAIHLKSSENLWFSDEFRKFIVFRQLHGE